MSAGEIKSLLGWRRRVAQLLGGGTAVEKLKIGFNILIAVLKLRFALYIKPKSPINSTALFFTFIFLAPKFNNSFARISV